MQALKIAATRAPQKPCHNSDSGKWTARHQLQGQKRCGLWFVRSSDLVQAGQPVFLIINTFRLARQSCELEIWKHLQGKTKCFVFPLKIPVAGSKSRDREGRLAPRWRGLGTPWLWHCEGVRHGYFESSVMPSRCQDHLSVLGIDATS